MTKFINLLSVASTASAVPVLINPIPTNGIVTAIEQPSSVQELADELPPIDETEIDAVADIFKEADNIIDNGVELMVEEIEPVLAKLPTIAEELRLSEQRIEDELINLEEELHTIGEEPNFNFFEKPTMEEIQEIQNQSQVNAADFVLLEDQQAFENDIVYDFQTAYDQPWLGEVEENTENGEFEPENVLLQDQQAFENDIVYDIQAAYDQPWLGEVGGNAENVREPEILLAKTPLDRINENVMEKIVFIEEEEEVAEETEITEVFPKTPVEIEVQVEISQQEPSIEQFSPEPASAEPYFEQDEQLKPVYEISEVKDPLLAFIEEPKFVEEPETNVESSSTQSILEQEEQRRPVPEIVEEEPFWAFIEEPKPEEKLQFEDNQPENFIPPGSFYSFINEPKPIIDETIEPQFESQGDFFEPTYYQNRPQEEIETAPNNYITQTPIHQTYQAPQRPLQAINQPAQNFWSTIWNQKPAYTSKPIQRPVRTNYNNYWSNVWNQNPSNYWSQPQPVKIEKPLDPTNRYFVANCFCWKSCPSDEFWNYRLNKCDEGRRTSRQPFSRPGIFF